MFIQAYWNIPNTASYNPKRCVLTLLSNISPAFGHGINSVRCQVNYAMGCYSYSHHFAGNSFTVQLNEIPTQISVAYSGSYVVKVFQGSEILKLSAKTQLKLLVDLVLAENPSKRFCR